ncbi:MAG TPA: hypothetical protein VN631_11795 [Negativicutes bacterium]|nr:hypothetical protein [Negativicutes bacterium]
MTILDGIIGVNEEKRVGLGEDSALRVDGDKAAILCSFDGCGGSGSKRYPSAEGWTGAKIAAHTCAHAVGDWFLQNRYNLNGFSAISAESLADDLKLAIQSTFNDTYSSIDQTRSAIKGSLPSTLPTTMSSFMLEQDRSGKIRCVFLWAGDSRGYLFTVKGLRQMTKDDSQAKTDDDDFAADGVLSNYVNQQKDFVIHSRETFVDSPMIALTVTDGCYAYYETPMDFEGILLETLMEAKSLLEWEQLLRERIGHVASDDYTLQMAIVGHGTFQALKNAYRPRMSDYRRLFSEPIAWMQAQNDRDGLIRLWNEYKKFYR